MKQVQNKEQIIRKVTLIGNGAHIFAPKEWLEDEVILIRVPKKPIEKRILDVLNPYLKNIEGVFLYGSYARNEQTSESDIDLLIIANKKISIKKENYEIIALQEKSFERAIKISPVLIYSALAEAKPIINSGLLENLRKEYKIQNKYLKEYLKETKEFIKINEEFPSLYSLILRLRGIYIINQLLFGKIYSNKKFLSWIKKSYPEVDLKRIKNYKKDYNLNEEEANFLINVLKQSVKKLEAKLNGEKRKKA